MDSCKDNVDSFGIFLFTPTKEECSMNFIKNTDQRIGLSFEVTVTRVVGSNYGSLSKFYANSSLSSKEHFQFF